MNSNQFRFVIAAAKSGSFSRAAELCFVTQPSLSNGISNLEDVLGEKLFIRTTRKVTLSKFGQAMLPKIEAILNAETELLNEAAEYLKPKNIALNIGISPLLNSAIVLKMIDAFKIEHPNFELFLQENNLKDLTLMLEQEELDLIFIPKVKEYESKQSLFLYSEPLECIDVSLKKERDKVVEYGQIKNNTFLMVPDSCGLSYITRNLFPKLNEYKGKALSYQVLENWAMSGLGTAILPMSKVTAGNRNGKKILHNNQEIKISYMAEWKNTRLIEPFLQFLNEYQSAQEL